MIQLFPKYRILKEKIVFEKGLIVKEGEIKSGGKTFSKYCVDRPNASAILILNTDSNKVVLTKQFRYPIDSKIKEDILEIVAGKVDPIENALQAALRESEEETGYKIKNENIKLLFSCFASPGYSAERFFIYYATVGKEDKIYRGGGKEDENEHIEVVEMDLDEFNKNIMEGKILDAKTYLAGMHLLLHKTTAK